MAGVQSGFPDGLAKTPFIAEVDPQRCDYCGECLRACNVKCIGLASDARGRAGRGAGKPARRYAEIDSDVCLGCGVCASACERQQFSMPVGHRPDRWQIQHTDWRAWRALRRQARNWWDEIVSSRG
jgi:ferredoxin